MKGSYTVSREGLNYTPILVLNVKFSLEARKEKKEKNYKCSHQMFTFKSKGDLPIILLSLMKL